MALVLEVKYGNAKTYVYDDLCSNLGHEEKRKLKVREIIGHIATAPGAAERLAASMEQRMQEPPVSVTYLWHLKEKR